VDIIIDDSRDNIVQKQIKGIVIAIYVVTTKITKNITLSVSDRSDISEEICNDNNSIKFPI